MNQSDFPEINVNEAIKCLNSIKTQHTHIMGITHTALKVLIKRPHLKPATFRMEYFPVITLADLTLTPIPMKTAFYDSDTSLIYLFQNDKIVVNLVYAASCNLDMITYSLYNKDISYMDMYKTLLKAVDVNFPGKKYYCYSSGYEDDMVNTSECKYCGVKLLSIKDMAIIDGSLSIQYNKENLKVLHMDPDLDAEIDTQIEYGSSFVMFNNDKYGLYDRYQYLRKSRYCAMYGADITSIKFHNGKYVINVNIDAESG